MAIRPIRAPILPIQRAAQIHPSIAPIAAPSIIARTIANVQPMDSHLFSAPALSNQRTALNSPFANIKRNLVAPTLAAKPIASTVTAVPFNPAITPSAPPATSAASAPSSVAAPPDASQAQQSSQPDNSQQDDSQPYQDQTQGYQDSSASQPSQQDTSSDQTSSDDSGYQAPPDDGSGGYQIPDAQTADDDPSQYGDGFGAESSPIACYVQRNCLSCVALDNSSGLGIVPLTMTVKLPSSYPDGPVNPGSNPEIDSAIALARKALNNTSIQEKQRMAAQSLVDRARCGDQNAMAIIALVAQNAKTSQRAAMAQSYIQAYIKANPVKEDGSFGTEPNDGETSVSRTAVRLANSPPLTKKRILNMVNVFGGARTRKRKLLAHGMTKFGADPQVEELRGRLDAVEKALLDFGRAIGLGRAIQIVRQNGRIAAISPAAAWEHGE